MTPQTTRPALENRQPRPTAPRGRGPIFFFPAQELPRQDTHRGRLPLRRRTGGGALPQPPPRPHFQCFARTFWPPMPGRRDGSASPPGLPQCRPGPASRGGAGAPERFVDNPSVTRWVSFRLLQRASSAPPPPPPLLLAGGRILLFGPSDSPGHK